MHQVTYSRQTLARSRYSGLFAGGMVTLLLMLSASSGYAGAQYQYSSKWRYSAGLSYDSALSKGKHRSAMIPKGEMTRFGGGVEYRKRSDLTVGAAMDVMWEGDLSLNNNSNGGTVSGEYENVFLAFFTVYAKWQ